MCNLKNYVKLLTNQQQYDIISKVLRSSTANNISHKEILHIVTRKQRNNLKEKNEYGLNHDEIRRFLETPVKRTGMITRTQYFLNGQDARKWVDRQPYGAFTDYKIEIVGTKVKVTTRKYKKKKKFLYLDTNKDYIGMAIIYFSAIYIRR